MTAFVYWTATSLNGFIADPDGSLQWLFDVGEDDADEMARFVAGVGVQVMGATTYQWLLDHEDLLARPDRWAEFFGDLPTRVFSTRALPVPAGADVQIVAGPVTDHLAALSATAGDRDVWVVGGGDLAGQFLDAGALTRIDLTIAPVFLTGGAPLLPRFVPASRLRLAEAAPRGSFVRLRYDVQR